MYNISWDVTIDRTFINHHKTNKALYAAHHSFPTFSKCILYNYIMWHSTDELNICKNLCILRSVQNLHALPTLLPQSVRTRQFLEEISLNKYSKK